MSAPALIELTDTLWREHADAHELRARRFGEPFIARRRRGAKHPIEDFLFTYYTQKPGQLYRWHPGLGVRLTGPQALQYRDYKFYRVQREGENYVAELDLQEFVHARARLIEFTRILLHKTAERPANFACFGLHEWAMAYQSELNGIRHDYLPLRLGANGTDRVVEEHRIRCTHFDAFRFYTPQAVGRNELQPTRETQTELEQPGCLHANMDLYKWASKLIPLVSSELMMDCFELAWDIRTMDMQASPYDLADWGFAPIPIETPEGKALYVREQKRFAERADVLRRRLLAVVNSAQIPPLPQQTARSR